MKKMNKKGFTIVELVIVIAVIAILAAVLIPTFTGIIKKANISADTQLVRNLNTALAEDKAINGEHKTMQSALDAAVEGGYIVARINAKATGNEILWDSVADAFCYLNDGKVEYTPDVTGEKAENDEQYKLWKIASAPDDTYSTYLYNIGDKTVFNVTTGIDVGNENVTSISYVRTSADSGQEVVIRTNGGTLTIGSSITEVAAGKIVHYGTLDEAVIYTTSNSFHTHGKIASMDLKAGKAVAEDKGYVALVKAAANTEIEEVDSGVFYIPAGVSVNDIDNDVAESLGYISDGETNATYVIDANSEAGQARAESIASTVYEISNANELEAFRDAWNAGRLEEGTSFALTADIDMIGRVWTPIGNDNAHAFSGYFDGRKHKISNLTSTNYTGPELVLSSSGTSGSGLGLFGWGIGNIEVKDLDLEVRFNEQSSYVGGVLGVYIRSNSDEETFSVKFKNITVDGSMVAKDKMGAIVGSTYASSYSGTNKTITIEFNNCTNNATIYGIDNNARIGGIAGTVSAQFAGDRANYGIVLNNEEKVLFIDCVNTSEAITSTSAEYKVGGIVGFLASPGNYEFNNCSSVEIANGGKLFGRYHFGGSESTYIPTGNPATGIGLENGFGYLDFTPIRYTQWDAYENTSKNITIYWKWQFADDYHGNSATYSIGTALASNQWRLTIDNNHYRCAYNAPINSASDCIEDTPHSVETRLPADHWTNNQYGMTVNVAGTYYTFTKESPNQ